MNTVTTINLGGKAYQLEEKGYTLLATYLAEATSALEGNPDKEEIIADFEIAVAEKCSRYLSDAKNVVTASEIETIIKEMGPVETNTDQSSSFGETEKAKSSPKRLYRDGDNRVIAGVASGLGHYFGVDPVILRIIFIASLFVGGAGFIAYIILWLAVPEAKTTAQKLEMRGSHVTLSSVSDILKEKVAEVTSKKNQGAWQKFLAIPAQIFSAIGTVIHRGIFPAVRIFIGVLLAFIGFLGAVVATTAVGAVLFSTPALFAELPVILSLAGGVFYIALIAGYVIVVIPLVLLFFGGLSLLRKKNHIKNSVGIALVIVWFVAIFTAGSFGARTLVQVDRHIQNDPSYMETTREIPQSAFTKLEVADSQRVSYVVGDEYSLLLEGRARDIDSLEITNTDGTLFIEQRPGIDRGCLFFCFSKGVHITVTAPELSDVTLKNASSIEGEFISRDGMQLVLKNASRATVYLETANTNISLQNSSSLEILGKAETLELSLKNASRYIGTDFGANTTILSAENGSYAELGQSNTLSVIAKNGSSVRYLGEPKVEKTLSNGSTVRKLSESTY